MSTNQENISKLVYIIPSTHWDREWYLPFQKFRFKLVQLIDELLKISSKKDYHFTLDGQTVVLEDYFEIRPERKNDLLEIIRKGKIEVGPWYLLPDEWLVGQESLIRNLEMASDLAKEYNIPLMPIGYLPDQFGHSRVIPQLLSDLTDFKAVIIWRGVGPEIDSVPFIWKSHEKSTKGLLCNYLPFGYGNAASLPEKKEELIDLLKSKINELKPYSPIEIYLLMNGTDHLFPQEFLIEMLTKIKIKNTHFMISTLNDYIEKLKTLLESFHNPLKVYSGEFRSSLRAPLLQDTYSARMWIKQWNNKVEDLLIHYAEPINAILHIHKLNQYPNSYFKTAWKWLLQNQPHDSICGCSVDQTHEEMKSRFYWAESITESLIKNAIEKIETLKEKNENNYLLTFNPTNNNQECVFIRFQLPLKTQFKSLISDNGQTFDIQSLQSKEEIFFENTFKPFMIKAGLRMLPGRKIMDVYINDVSIIEDKENKKCFITLICDRNQIGKLNEKEMVKKILELIDSNNFNFFHVKATLGTKQTYATMLPLKNWSFDRFLCSRNMKKREDTQNILSLIKNIIENKFYIVKFNKKGTIDLYDKLNKITYQNLHLFEDNGDRGDEYTFSKIEPTTFNTTNVKRIVKNKGEIFIEVEQKVILKTYKELDKNRTKRTGKVNIPIISLFRFYRDIPRIDVQTTITNITKDHRLRICFNLPFKSDHTLTSTHFGYIKRQGDPFDYKEYVEKPTGIQSQKKFIRIEDEEKQIAFSLFNKGLPEVELENKSKLALTLIRSIGFLSRQDFPERPMHAGPFLETPGAQELNKEYIFNYSFYSHAMNEPMSNTWNNSELSTLEPIVVIYEKAIPKGIPLTPIAKVDNSNIKISSIRVSENNLLITLFNLEENIEKVKLSLTSNFTAVNELYINKTIKNKLKIEKGITLLEFQPFEIKFLEIKK